jgi:prephenate dehydrogenase
MGFGKMGSWLWALLKDDFDLAIYEISNAVIITRNDTVFLKNMTEVEQFSPDLVINCTTLSRTREAFEDLLPFLPSGCLLADIASVKSDISGFYRECGFQYVSVHPMFGPTFSDMKKLEGRTAFIITESETAGKEFFTNCFTSAGITCTEISFEEHDKLMAKYLSAPFITALLFTESGGADPVKGTTFDRYHEISGGVLREDSELVSAILANPFTSGILVSMANTLANVTSALSNTGDLTISDLLGAAREKAGIKV